MATYEESAFGRRQSLAVLTVGAGSLALWVGCVACKEDKPTLGGTEEKPAPRSPTPSTDCAASIDDASKALRRALQYKATSDQPAKLCSACVQFIANKYGTCGGGCKLITGPVLPGGSCLSYAPVTSDAASPVKAL